MLLASKIFIHSIEQAMGRVRNTSMSVLLVLLCCICLEFGSATNTITASRPIKDPDFIISNGSAFKLGFFNPKNSTNRYVGIWYNNISAFTVVWVANREKPLRDSNGVLTISEDGVLVVLNGEKEVIWSADVTNSTPNSSAQLWDSGNLVLQENATGTVIWESFQYPSDTVLPTMKLSANVKTGKKVQITSWKSPSDPSIGSFSCGIQPPSSPQVFIWKNGSPYWRSGPWNNRIFIGVPDMNSVYLDGFRSGDDPDGSFYITFDYVDKSVLSNFALTPQGNLVQKYNGVEDIGWSAMNSECDVYSKCGAFGTCNPQNTPICSCLQGFKANNTEEWNRGNWTSGCVRRTPLQCERVNAGGDDGKKDGFLKLKMMKVPDIAAWSSASENKCREQCLENCSCIGYAYDIGFGCMSWTDKLIDTQQFSSFGVDLYIRVAYSELDKVVDVKKIVTITVIIGTIFIFICTYLLWRWMAKQKVARKKKATKISLFNREEAPSKFHSDNLDQVKVQELPLFNFEKLASATNNFHLSNKLGQGGFGPVYWGKLIFGCCVEGEEKMLIYEYMPNKSLDAFLFDLHKEKSLDWRKRFNIIEGIGRDFGMAKIFGNNEEQANTNRVVGTYGYMSPEYAMEGRFSEKSDDLHGNCGMQTTL
nr:g-type lectin s-receptor-like serine/threonine-protein kinase [Quercus suber]